jgi:hypothetical protein
LAKALVKLAKTFYSHLVKMKDVTGDLQKWIKIRREAMYIEHCQFWVTFATSTMTKVLFFFMEKQLP